MLCDQTTHLWLGRFSIRLMQLRPTLSLTEAVRRAVSAHGHAHDLAPEEAASIDATVATWRLPPSAARTAPRAPVRRHRPARETPALSSWLGRKAEPVW